MFQLRIIFFLVYLWSWTTYFKTTQGAYKQEWNYVLRGNSCMVCITWITKKSFLNDNFALYITSWLWNWVTKSSCPILRVDFWGPKWAILRVGIRFKIVLGCTHIVQLLFSVSFDLDIWFWVGSFWLSLALMGYFLVVVI